MRDGRPAQVFQAHSASFSTEMKSVFSQRINRLVLVRMACLANGHGWSEFAQAAWIKGRTVLRIV